MSPTFKFLILFCLFHTVVMVSTAQVNNDSLLSSASLLAKNGDYNKAKDIVYAVVRNDSTRSDALVMLANLNFWTGENKSALYWIDKASSMKATDSDFYTSYLNILLANKKYTQLLEVADKSVADGYSDQLNLMQKSLIALQQLGNYTKALELYNSITDESIKLHPSVLAIIDKMNDQIHKKSLVINYSIDVFSNANPQHLAGIAYAYKPKRNSYGFGVNYANRFSQSDVQVETTNYLYLSDSRYVYTNYGFGINSTLFPRHRAGLEYYFPVTDKLESSLGGRYLTYSSISDNKVYILTGHLGGYIGKGWMALRPFWVIKDDLQSLTVSLKYRKYGKRSRDFSGIELLVGNSPDDMYSISQSGFNNLKSYKIRFERSWRIDSKSDLIIAPAYSYEQFARGLLIDFRSRFGMEFSYRF